MVCHLGFDFTGEMAWLYSEPVAVEREIDGTYC